MSTAANLQDQTALFRKSWNLYDAITAFNYMNHREIYRVVGEVIHGRSREGSYSILDLGCGNARFLGECLRASPPVSYRGVDLSASALEDARSHLAGIPGVALEERDLLAAVEDAGATYDIIFSGFAVHHLDSADKQRLFHACANHLAPGGQFLMVDIVREDDQTREACVGAYLQMMRVGWTQIPPDQLGEACAHVAAYDQPETLAALGAMAAAAGLNATRLLARFGPHHVVQFAASRRAGSAEDVR